MRRLQSIPLRNLASGFEDLFFFMKSYIRPLKAAKFLCLISVLGPSFRMLFDIENPRMESILHDTAGVALSVLFFLSS